MLAAPAIVVDAENPACGDRLRLSALIRDGVVVEAAFQVKGCTASIACGSALAEWLIGKRLGAIVGVARTVEDAVGGLPASSKHAAALCEEAVRLLARRVGG